MKWNWKGIPVWLVVVTLISGNLIMAQDPIKDKLDLYGYFSVRYGKTYSEPGLDGNSIVKETAPGEWEFPYFNLMVQYPISDRFKVFMNFNGSGMETLDIRNAWGEYSVSRAFNVRLGKSYRKFGLYNEILDAVPTYYGIEAPELFDTDHLIVSRTTAFMLHGGVDAGSGMLNYAFTTDNGEGDSFSNALPIGYDLRYQAKTGAYTLGMSGYTSAGPATSNVSVGDGSPKSGVLPWMAEDDFWVFGGFAETNVKQILLQGEYWRSNHDALRDAARTVEMIQGGKPNRSQLSRFLLDPAGPIAESNINTNGNYTIETWYLRAGYAYETERGEFAPYLQWDSYSNPEVIGKKTFGGDNEAGVSDNGRFGKWTVGLVYRPRPEVAVKLDASSHRYKLGGQHVSYPEVRADVSFIWGR